MPDCETVSILAPREHVECRVVAAVLGQRMIVAAEFARDVLIQRQIMPAALALEDQQPLDRRPRHHRERNALLNVRHLAIPCAEQRRAHRARPLSLRAIHVVVDHEGVLVAEQLGERCRSVFACEGIVLVDLAARRQRAALFGDALDVAAKLDLFSQQRLAGAAIFGALVGKANVAGARQLGGRFQGGTAHGLEWGTAYGMTSFSARRHRPALTGRPSRASAMDREASAYWIPRRLRGV